MLENCDIIVIFRIFGQFEVIRRQDSGHRVWKSYVFSISNLFLTKTENRTNKSLTQLSHYCFEERYFFGQKTLIFLQKNAGIIKIKGI